MRQECMDCVRKHIAQAIILLDEYILGYPHHRWLAVGHLAEAESEVMAYSVKLASEIRKERLKIMNNAENPKLEYLIIEASKILGEDDSISSESSKYKQTKVR
jgi:hypothetical protein